MKLKCSRVLQSMDKSAAHIQKIYLVKQKGGAILTPITTQFPLLRAYTFSIERNIAVFALHAICTKGRALKSSTDSQSR